MNLIMLLLVINVFFFFFFSDTAVAKNEDSLTILKVLSNHVKTKFEEVIILL